MRAHQDEASPAVGGASRASDLMRRVTLERQQVWCYLAAVVVGLGVGSRWPSAGETAETLVWPVLALLLYTTFTQMPLMSLPAAFGDLRFLATALAGNFLVVPVVVWLLVQLTPDDPALRLGLLLVLLVPCTDWFITFSQLGRADATRATALTPITLVVQLLLLPLYLYLMTDADVSPVLDVRDVWPALLVVLAPLASAALTEAWAGRTSRRRSVVEGLGWWPVPLLTVVIGLVASAHVTAVRDAADLLPVVVGVATAYLVLSLVLARLLAEAAGLPREQGRTLAFSLGTRNSFIVLPFALALPPGWETVALVVVMQSLAELFGMVFYLWFVPHVLFADVADD